MPSELLHQHQQQTPINGTISGMKPPGNETGYYYIPIANLPWQTSWQELKDHVRKVCPVERVEINEDSTSGHVVLRGRTNFDAAFRLLNGGVFHDRALIADGRNVDSWVLVKQHVDGNSSSPPLSSASRYTAPPPHHTSLLMAQASPGHGEWPAAPVSSSYFMSPVMASSPGLVPSGMAEYPSSAALYGAGSCAVEFSRTMANPMMQYSAGPGYAQHEGRVLEAKHAKEGASDHHSSHSSRSHRSHHQRHSHQSQHPHRERHERHEGKQRKGREKESSHKSASSGDKKSKSSSSKPDIIIANGSSLSVSLPKS